MSKLKICKASAGSGKTHKLTGEYLNLVFDDKISFRNVLAVTFTNKATAEMRERILRAIHELSQGKPSDYEKELCDRFGFSRGELQKKATRLLNQMLNQYSYFKISTIDSFFQQIIKSVAYELNLENGFTLEIDDNAVIEMAVSQMIDSIASDSDSDAERVNSWIMQAVSEKIADGKAWNVQKDIVDFAKSAFNKVGISAFNGSDGDRLNGFDKYKAELTEIRKSYIKEINELGSKAVDEMGRLGLTVDSFSHKGNGGIGQFFVRCSAMKDLSKLSVGVYVNEANENIDKCISGKKKEEQVSLIAQSQLPRYLAGLVELLTVGSVKPLSAEAALKYVNGYALVANVANEQRKICDEQNMFLLSWTMPFLSKMIGDSDAPFIYEKIGYSLRHFMIDEFQDTSTLNWENLFPLVNNGLSEGHDSLIVGDVKQAIYRWRAGDWNLLDNKVQRQFGPELAWEETLDYNWRSCRNVVTFNNWCFKSIYNLISAEIRAKIEANDYKPQYLETLDRTYGGLQQKIPARNENSGGHVSIDFLDAKKSDEYAEMIGEWLVGQIDRLSELGFQPGDMAILVRTNSQATGVANILACAQSENPAVASRYRFVSNESVLLGNSQALRLLISAMQFLLTPDKVHVKAQLIWLYFAKTQGLKTASEKIQQIDFDGDAQLVWEQMPAEFRAIRDSYVQLDIVQLCSRLIQIFFGLGHQVDASDSPFLNEFEDRVQTFSERNGSNLQQFIDWWSNIGFGQTITMNDRQNAIQILSIHKSKGLEFKAVLLPYTNFSEKSGDIIWCATDKEPFCKFSPVPVSKNKGLAQTYFRDSYFEEEFMRTIDNLNLLYVAFTRASVDMRACSMVMDCKAVSIENIFNAIYSQCADSADARELGIERDEDLMRLSIGAEQEYQSEVRDDAPGSQTKAEIIRNVAKISIRHHSDDFYLDNDYDRKKRINVGNLYHHIFEHIKYANDVKDAVLTIANDGLIAPDEASEYESKVARFVSQQPDWFSNRWTVLTEQSIMLENGDIKRPDRILESDTEMVVIDYKFTNRHDEKYNEQVGIYVDALRKLTDKTVKGYLWYVWPNETVEVCG